MANWLERAKREIRETPCRPTANTAETQVSSVTAVPHPSESGISGGGFGSFGSTPSADFLEIDAAIPRLCDARGDGDGNRAALLSNVREYPPERWLWLIGYFNAEAVKYRAASGADDDDRRHCAVNLTPGGRCLAARRGEIAASRNYQPLDDIPRRCEGYAPKAGDPDQRPGRERWPGLTIKGGDNGK